MLIPDSISPENQTRSSARLGYYDGFTDSRPNFHIASQQHVTRVLLNQDTPAGIEPRDYPSGRWISGVEVRSFFDRSTELIKTVCNERNFVSPKR